MQSLSAINSSAIGEEKPAADAERPGIAGKQSVAADRSREQRTGAFRQDNKRRLGVGNNRAATAKNKWPLRF